MQIFFKEETRGMAALLKQGGKALGHMYNVSKTFFPQVSGSLTFKYQINPARGLGKPGAQNALSNLPNFKPMLTSIYPNA